MPDGRLLIRVGDLQDPGFSAVWSDDLQADGQSGFGEPAWQGNRRQSPDVDGARVTQQEQFSRPEKIGILF